MIMVPLFAFAMALVIRIAATVIFWREGIKSLPENFRVLILCISPSQIPELVPGIEATNSLLAFSGFRKFVASFDLAPEPIRGLNAAVKEAVYVSQALILFLPAWAYRTTIKSTIWFWWPLAFIGGDLRFAGKPDLLRWNLIGSLWAKASILIAFLSLLAFICTNAFLDGAIFEKNPLITPIGYFLLLDWRLQPWQICAILASAMSVVLVFWMDHIAGRFRIAENTGDTALQRTVMTELGWMERFARLRFLFVLSFWFLVAAHALLYLNGQTCAVHLPDYVQRLAHTIYGNRTPKNLCTQNTAKQNGVPIGRDDLIDAVCARLLVLERSRAGCGSIARRLGSSGLTIHPG
jgi:hypothetical protein